jgi:hypothetical protein
VPADVSLTIIHPKPPKKPPANPFLPPDDPTLRIEGPKGKVNLRHKSSHKVINIFLKVK